MSTPTLVTPGAPRAVRFWGEWGWWGCVALAGVIGLCGLVASLAVGAAGLSLAEVFGVLTGSGTDAAHRIVLEYRLPRALCALAAGAALAVSGVLLQSVTRNPLADPGLVGVTAGAGLAATIVLAALPGRAGLLPVFAFGGAMVSAVVVYSVSWRPGAGSSAMRMVLAGVAVNALLGAVIGVLITMYADRVPTVMFWTAGSFNGRGWGHLRLMLPYVAVGLALAAWLRPSLGVMELGDDTAASLGVRVERVRLLAFAAAALLAGAAVSVAGLVGFVGLVVPHVARLLVGGSARWMLLSCVLGAVLLVWSDLAARTVLSPNELPVGVLTALIGGPYFVFLLYRSGWLK